MIQTKPKSVSLSVVAISLTLSTLLTPAHAKKSGADWMEEGKKGELEKKQKIAVRSYKRASRISETKDAGTIALAKFLIKEGDITTAHEILNKYVSEENPFSVDAHLCIAEVHVAKNDFPNALKEIEYIETLKPGYDKANEIRGLALLQAHRLDESIVYLSKVLIEKPDYSKIRITRAQAYKEILKINEAIADLEIVFQQDTADLRSAETLGDLYVSAKKPDDASGIYERILSQAPDNSSVWMKLSAIQLAQGKTESGIQSLKKVVDLKPNDLETGNRLGQLYLKQNMRSAAESEFKREYKLDPSWAVGVKGFVAILSDGKRYNELGATLKEYTVNFPDQTWAVTIYSKLLMKLGQFGSAKKLLDKNRSAAGESAESSIMEASLLHSQGKDEEALKVLSVAEGKFPGKLQIAFSIALLQEDMGNYTVAMTKYQQATEDAQVSYKAKVNLALLHERLGNFTEALNVLKSIDRKVDSIGMVAKKISEMEAFVRSGVKNSSSRAPASLRE